MTPLELANVYCTFASGGIVGQPVSIRALGGEAQPPAQLAPTLKPEVAYVMVSLMRSVIDEGTAHAAIAGKLRRPAAGKTGTSNDQRDAWFVGFTPDLLAAVWVGFDDMKKLGRGETGGKAATPIWADFMSKATGRPSHERLRAAARDRRPAYRQGERPAGRRRSGVEHAGRGLPRRHRAHRARRRRRRRRSQPRQIAAR